MEVRVRDKAFADEAAQKTWGALDTVEVIAEVLRSEVTARGSSPRHSVVRRVHDSLSETIALERDRITETCRQLAKQGDFTTSSGGFLHATPVRAVELEAAEYRLFSSLPTYRLLNELSTTIEAHGSSRFLKPAQEHAKTFQRNLIRLGGLVLSPEGWAGFASQLTADTEWLQALEKRLEWLPEAAGSLERDNNLDWRGLVITETGAKFPSKAANSARLWRAKSSYGRWLWAWASPDRTPCTGSFVTLSSDEAARTVYAVARNKDRPLAVRLTKDSGDATLEFENWLPRAEYRYLSVHAKPSTEAGRNSWSIPNTRIESVLATLKDRLGVRVQEMSEA